MKKYKLIKKYPGSPLVGTTVEEDSHNQYVTEDIIIFSKAEVETYSEFWEEVKEFKVDDWVRWIGWPGISIRKIKSLDPFKWYENDDDGYRLKKYPEEYRLATPEEIETYLIAEAKRKGFEVGVQFKSAYTGRERIIRNGIFYCAGDLIENDRFNGDIIYNGDTNKWAEIIKKEEIKIGEYVAKFGNDTVSFGCKKYTKMEVKDLYEVCLTFGIFSIHAHNHLVPFELIKKIYNRMK